MTKNGRFEELEVVRKTNQHHMEESWLEIRVEAWGKVPGNPWGYVKYTASF